MSRIGDGGRSAVRVVVVAERPRKRRNVAPRCGRTDQMLTRRLPNV